MPTPRASQVDRRFPRPLATSRTPTSPRPDADTGALPTREGCVSGARPGRGVPLMVPTAIDPHQPSPRRHPPAVRRAPRREPSAGYRRHEPREPRCAANNRRDAPVSDPDRRYHSRVAGAPTPRPQPPATLRAAAADSLVALTPLGPHPARNLEPAAQWRRALTGGQATRRVSGPTGVGGGERELKCEGGFGCLNGWPLFTLA